MFIVASLVVGMVSSAGLAASNDSPGPETVIAGINGTKITLGQFEEERAHNLFQARDGFYNLEKKILDDYIENMLLKQEAQKQGLTVEQLLDKQVRSTLPKDPSEESLHVYYEGVDSKEPYAALREKILNRIRQLRFDRAKAAYMQTLKAKSNVVVSLPPPRAEIALTNTPVLGDKNAPVLLIEYADYECPYCQQVAPALRKLENEYKGRVAFAFKDTPLPMHPHAQKAAEAARCAGAQGKYWDFYHELFASKKLDLPDLKSDAQKLKLDQTAFDKCLDSGSQAAAVKTQSDEASELGLQGTPSFFVNGRFMSGAASYEQLKDAIEQELAIASKQQLKQTAQR